MTRSIKYKVLEFTPLEFETCNVCSIIYDTKIRIYSVGVWNYRKTLRHHSLENIRIYSVGVWNKWLLMMRSRYFTLEFTPLEFETTLWASQWLDKWALEFTPLEFETLFWQRRRDRQPVLEFTPLEFETQSKSQAYDLI